MICGTNLWYTVSTGCVECVKNRAKERYAGLDEAQKAEHKVRDQVRHTNAKLSGRRTYESEDNQ